MVQALRLNTMSKLTFADSSRFDALVRDVFSGVSFADVDDQILTQALEQVYKEARLELIPSQVCLCTHRRLFMGCILGSLCAVKKKKKTQQLWPFFHPCVAEEGTGAE